MEEKLIALTVASHDHPYLQALKRSAEKVGMPFHAIITPWKGFGTKIIATRDYLKTLTGYTHFVFVDAYDTLFLRPFPAPPPAGIVFSTEKHKWPDHDAPYPYDWTKEDPWPFLNSGAYIAKISSWCDLVDRNPVDYADDDQRYFTKLFLKGEPIALDTGCKLFQSYAFMEPGDFDLFPFKNNIHNSYPSIIHFNGKCHEQKIYRSMEYQSLADVKAAWADTPDNHKKIHESFVALVNDNDQLNAHRTFVENYVFGFGERSFHWMWDLIVKELPDNFTFLEIGVLKGQVLSLVQMLADMHGKKAKRYGVTPLNTEGGVWDDDYEGAIKVIHDQFKLAKDYIILKGLSEDPEIIKKAGKLKLHALLIDGGHETRHIQNDFENYAPLVVKGGFLVIDDSCNSMQMPFGYFQGIQAVTNYIDSVLPPMKENPEWEFLFSCVHNRVYRRK